MLFRSLVRGACTHIGAAKVLKSGTITLLFNFFIVITPVAKFEHVSMWTLRIVYLFRRVARNGAVTWPWLWPVLSDYLLLHNPLCSCSSVRLGLKLHGENVRNISPLLVAMDLNVAISLSE